MPSFPIQLKRNGTAAATPSSLLHGEVALNYADGKLFWKDASNVIQSFTFQAYALSSHTHAASDITSGTLDAARIANDSITYAKIQNVSATDRLLGRSSAGAGDVEEITCTSFGRSLIDDADAAAARSTLSVQPTASPAFTGAATVTNDGNVVPLTVTNTGTANSFVVNDESGDTTPFVVDAAGRVVAGGSAPASEAHKVSIVGTLPTVSNQSVGYIQRGTVPSSSTVAMISYSSLAITDAASFTLSSFQHFRALQSAIGAGSSITNQYGFFAHDSLTGATNNYGFYSDIASGTGRFNFYANGTAANYFAGPTTITSPLTLTGTVAGNVRALKLQTSGVDRWQITPSFDAETGSNAGSNFHITRWSDAGSFMGTPLYITRSTGVVNCESGLTIVSGQLLVTAGSGSAGSYKPGVAVSGDDDSGLMQAGGANTISLVTAGSERVRVDASGNVCVNSTGDTNPAGSNVAGACLAQSGYLSITRDSDNPLLLNRKTNDGTLTSFQHDAATEGTISVSGNTVSYNAFCGSHWAQLIDGSRPAILRGTVLETIDEMCEWPGEPRNDRLPRVKVSDTPRSRRVYGVFMAWDEDDAATGDMYATALGAYMVRVSGVVHSGDLLESAGDGTARTQPDDIVRSSTIGKVSSTHRVAEYDDGSYLVPCVLMCG